MGVYHSIYAEIKYRDKWYSLNPIYKSLKNNEYTLDSIISGKSYLHDAFEELEEQSVMRGLPDDLSDDLRNNFKVDFISDPEDDEDSVWKYYNQYSFVADYNQSVALRMANKPKKEHSGYVKKNDIVSFEEGDLEEIEHYLTREEYFNLSDTGKRGYSYYEWNNTRYGYYGVFKEIVTKVSLLANLFTEQLWSLDDGHNHYDIESCYNNIRLICTAS